MSGIDRAAVQAVRDILARQANGYRRTRSYFRTSEYWRNVSRVEQEAAVRGVNDAIRILLELGRDEFSQKRQPRVERYAMPKKGTTALIVERKES